MPAEHKIRYGWLKAPLKFVPVLLLPSTKTVT